MTTMASISSLAGTVRITFLAPACEVPLELGAGAEDAGRLDDESTPSSPQGISAGSRSAVIATLRPPT